jgi:hypothetical protein
MVKLVEPNSVERGRAFGVGFDRVLASLQSAKKFTVDKTLVDSHYSPFDAV